MKKFSLRCENSLHLLEARAPCGEITTAEITTAVIKARIAPISPFIAPNTLARLAIGANLDGRHSDQLATI
jgi:hypothetical protein